MRKPIASNQNGGAFLILVIVLSVVAVLINSYIATEILKTDETREDVKRALAAFEASEQLAVMLRGSYDMAQAYGGSCPSGTSLTTINSLGFCLPTNNAGKCIKNPLIPTVELCLNSTQVQLSQHTGQQQEETSHKATSIAALRESLSDLAKLPGRAIMETAEAQVNNANLPVIPASAPSLTFAAPTCPGDPLCKSCSGTTLNTSMHCIDMILCLRNSCGPNNERFVQTIGFPHY